MFRMLNLPANTMALVMRNGAISEILSPGKHVVYGAARVVTYYTYGRFIAPASMPIEIALTHEALASQLKVTHVPTGSIALVFRDGRYEDTFGAGILAFFKGVIDYRTEVFDLTAGFLAPESLVALRKIHPELRTYVRELVVPVGSRGLLLVDGELKMELDAGSVYVLENGARYEVKFAPIGIEGMEVSGQEILTADKANVRVNYYFRYRVTNAKRALTEAVEYLRELRMAAALALREHIGALTLDELLTGKVAINEAVAEALRGTEDSLGVRYESGGIRDVILPGEMREIVNRVLVAEKTAEANAIVRKDEVAATRNMLNAAKLMDDHPMLRRLKEMEYVERVAERIDRISVSGDGDVMSGLRSLLVPRGE